MLLKSFILFIYVSIADSDGYVHRRRQPPLLAVPVARTKLLQLSPLTKSIRTINLVALRLDVFTRATLEDCTATLNHSDCGLRPTMVYTNFSPMSMCHPAIWRGCPTQNKFVTEYQCMQFCYDIEINEVKNERCGVPLNISMCSGPTKQVYTFSSHKKECVKALWHGCPTENMFANKTSCTNACNMKWVDALAKMDISEVKETSKLINAIVQKLDAPKNKLNDSGKVTQSDDSALAYFIHKLQKVNKELDSRTENGFNNFLLT